MTHCNWNYSHITGINNRTTEIKSNERESKHEKKAPADRSMSEVNSRGGKRKTKAKVHRGKNLQTTRCLREKGECPKGTKELVVGQGRMSAGKERVTKDQKGNKPRMEREKEGRPQKRAEQGWKGKTGMGKTTGNSVRKGLPEKRTTSRVRK